jgi:hypothetical protein
LAGKATTALKLPVSLQIVLRALIGEGLKRDDEPAFLANVEGQALAVRHIRRATRQGGAAKRHHRVWRQGVRQQLSSRERDRGRK